MSLFKVNYKIQNFKTGRFAGEGILYTTIPIRQIELRINIEILNSNNQICLIEKIERIKGDILT